MGIIDDKESDEIDHMGESKEDDLESEELETDERYQIENTESLKRIDSQKDRDNDDIVDIYIELEKNVVKTLS